MISNCDGFERGKIYDIPENQLSKFTGCYKQVDFKNKKPNLTKKIKKVLIVKGHGIGNAINIIPTIKILKQNYKELLIDIYCKSQNTEIFNGMPEVSEIYSEKRVQNKTVYDVVFMGAPADTESMRLLNDIRFKKIVRANHLHLRKMHEVEANIKMLDEINIKTKSIPKTSIIIDQKTKEKINDQNIPKKIIGICPGYLKTDDNYWNCKNWGTQKFIELINKLISEYSDHSIVIISGKDDFEAFNDFVNDRVLNLCWMLSIKESCEVLQRCDFVVANDTGAGHMASAVGTKVYSIFGPTSIIKNRPWNGAHIITAGLECSPCQFSERWNSCTDLKCMKALTVQNVFDEIKEDQKIFTKKYELGIIMGVYERYDTLIATFQSLLNCPGFRDLKMIITDDCSQNPKIKEIIDEFKIIAKPRGVDIYHDYLTPHRGREKYNECLQSSFGHAKNCKYAVMIPDDVIVNPWLFDAIREGFKYYTNQIKCIQYFQDSHSFRYKKHRSGPDHKSGFFYETLYQDGVLTCYETAAIEGMRFECRPTSMGTGVWNKWRNEFHIGRGFTGLCYKESLVEHIGNQLSVLNSDERRRNPIYGINVNLFEKPIILERG